MNVPFQLLIMAKLFFTTVCHCEHESFLLVLPTKRMKIFYNHFPYLSQCPHLHFPLYSSNCAIVIACMYGCGINLILETGTHFPNEKIADEIIHLKLFRPYLKKGAN